jgi:hypothetical protein
MNATDNDKIAIAERAEALAFEDQFAALPPPMASGLGMSAARFGGATALFAQKLPVTLFNRVMGLGVHEPATEALLDEIGAAYAARGVATHWLQLAPAARPEALGAWLEARGYAPPARASWAKMIRARVSPPVIATDLTVRPISMSEVDAVAAVLVEAHRMPPAIAPWIGALASRPGWQAYGAFDGERVVAAGCLYLRDDVGWLGLAGTLPSHRNRGAQGAIMARRIADALERGARWVVTETGEPVGEEKNPSLANMYRCGFERACARLNWESRTPPK